MKIQTPKTFFTFITALLLLALPVSALERQAHSTGWPQDQSDLPVDERLSWGTLKNGLRYVIMPNQEPPGRMSLQLYVQTGSLMELESQRGLAHFIEHLAFNGSTNFPPGEVIEFLQRMGLGFGPDTNAHTGFDRTVYELDLPKNTTEYLDEALSVLRDFADGVTMAEKEINKERGIILSEKRSRDSVDQRTTDAWIEFLFPETLLHERLPIGIESVIENAQRPVFLDYYKRWYRADRMILIVVGDIDPSTVEERIVAKFSSMAESEGTLDDPYYGEIARRGVTAHLHTELEAPVTTVSIQTVQPYDGQFDSREVRRKKTYRRLANAILNRRFEILSKEPNAPFFAGSAMAFDYLKLFSMASVQLICQPHQWEGALEIAEKQLRKALQHGFTQAELNEVKANYLNALEEAVQTAPTRKSSSLARELMGALNSEQVYTSPEEDLALGVEFLAEATPLDLLIALRDVWESNDRYLFLSGNLELENPESEILDVYESSQAIVVHEPIEEEIVPFAYDYFGTPGVITGESTVEDLGISQVYFENNVVLTMKPTDFEANTIYVALRFGRGSLTEPFEKLGLSLLAGSTYTLGGLGRHSADDLERLLAGKSISAVFSVGEDNFILSGVTRPKDLTLQLQLLTAFLTDPGYRQEALRLAHKGFEQAYIEKDHTLRGVLGDRVSRYLASEHPHFGYPEKQVLMARTLDEVSDWLTEALTDSKLEVVIVGDFDKEAATEAVASTFGALSERDSVLPEFEEARKSVYFPTEESHKRFTLDSEIPKAYVGVYWPTEDMWNIQRTRKLNLLSHILSDRLRVDVREKLGEAYSPRASSFTSNVYEGYGFMKMGSIVSPDKTDLVGQAIKGSVAKLLNDGVSQDEFTRALQPILSSVKEILRSNRYWEGILLDMNEYPRMLDWARTLTDGYEALTPQDIDAIAKEYLLPEKALVIEVIPEDAKDV